MPFPPTYVLVRLLVALNVSSYIMYSHQYNVNLEGVTKNIFARLFYFNQVLESKFCQTKQVHRPLYLPFTIIKVFRLHGSFRIGQVL
jgi:hypothetical protein